MATSVELRHERATVWEAMKALNAGAETEKRDLNAEEREQWDRMETQVSTLDDRIERAEKLERAPAAPAKVELPTERPGETRTVSADEAESRKAEEQNTWMHWLRFGPNKMTDEQRAYMASRQAQLPEEVRAMGIALDTAGGYLVPGAPQAAIEDAMKFYGGMRQAAYVFRTSTGGDLPIPTDDDTSNSGAVLGENTQISTQDVGVGAKVMKAYTYTSKLVLVSIQLIQDSAFDLEGWLTNKLGERIGRAQNTDFTTGAGGNKPVGITLDATTGVNAASATAIAADELFDLEHSVDIAYRQGGRFMMADSTLKVIRKLKDGEGRYLFQPGLTQGAPNQINGRDYTINNDMAAVATGNVSMLFGQFSKYFIRDVTGIQIMALRERYADYLQVGFLAFQRCDGKLIDAGQHPIKSLLHP